MLKKALIVALATVILVPVVVIASWRLMEGALAATSGPGFCTTCHTMEPFARTFHANVHGGNNARGLAADCTDCHLRHDSRPAYLWTKARFGLHDIWA